MVHDTAEQVTAKKQKLRQCDQVFEARTFGTTKLQAIDRRRKIGDGNSPARIASGSIMRRVGSQTGQQRRIAARQRTAVDRDRVTVDRSGIVRREKHGGRGNFFRCDRALHRDHAQEELAHGWILQLFPRQRRLHQAGRDADDTDTATAEFQRAAARDHVHAGLRRTIGRPAPRRAGVRSPTRY